jgi:hypothetical protein
MVLGGVHDMTLPDSLYFYLGKLLLDVCSVVGGHVYLAKRGVDTVNDYVIRIWLPVTASRRSTHRAANPRRREDDFENTQGFLDGA